MKKIKAFLKRPAAALLLLAVVLTMSVGTLWAKYAMDVKVTDSLSLSVEVGPTEYIIDAAKMWKALKNLKLNTLTNVSFVTGSTVPANSILKTTDESGIEAEDSKKINLYISSDYSTAYIAPADSSDNTSVIYAPADSSHFLDGSTDFTNLGSQLKRIDCRNLDTSRVTNMESMFAYGTNLSTVAYVSNFNTSNVENMSRMFGGCESLTGLDLSKWNTSNVKLMVRMFSACYGLTSLNLSNWDTSNVTSMMYMFADCSALPKLDLSSFNTSKVTTMVGMFANCSKLTGLDLSKFNTTNVTNIGDMFSGCSNLTSLDLSGFNTTSVTGMFYMFSGCSNLTSLNLSGFNTTNVRDMLGMFKDCSSLTELDLSGFYTPSVTSVGSMFEGCTSLETLDLSNFDTTNVGSTSLRMFTYCYNLTTVTLGKNFVFQHSGMYLPVPNSTYITNADGKWYDTTTGTGYDSSELATFHNSLDQTRTYTAVFGWLAGHIRLKINVYSVDDAGNATLTSGVPVIVRRILPDSWTSLAGWNNLVASFSGTSDENGVVYIDRTYTWSETDGKKTVWLGTDQTNMDNIVFFHANNTMRFDIIVDASSGYNLNPVDGKIRNCVTYYNGGPWKLTTAEGYSYDDFEFHGGLPAGDNSGSNNGGAYIEYNLYVKQMDQQTNSLNSSSAKTVTLDLSSLENIDASPASETAGTED